MYVINPIGIVRNGSKNERHRYPEDELPLHQKTKERIIEVKSSRKNGIIKKWNLMIPGPRLSGGYLIKLSNFSLGQLAKSAKLKMLTVK